jgi:putative MATE family efflux protein
MTSNAKTVAMTEGPLLGVLIRVALPITFTNLCQSTYDIINAFWLGHLGQDAIAAVAASGPLFFVLVSLSSGLSTAGAVLIAQNAGAKRRDVLDHVTAQTLLMVIALAVAFALFGNLSAPLQLQLVGVEPNVARLADGYLSVRYVGMIPMFTIMAMQAMLQAVGEVRFAMWVLIGSIILNAALDPVLIFGVGPVPVLGVRGAAAATVISQIAALLVIFHHLLTGRSALHLRVHNFRPDFAQIKLAIGLGVPASIEQAIRTFSSLLLMSLAASFGTVGLASYGVGTRLMFFWFAPTMGLGVAAATVVGQNIGAGRPDRAEAAVRTAAWLGFGSLTLIGLAHIPFVPQIMSSLAPGEPDVIRNASSFAYVFLPFLGVVAVTQAFLGAFRGAGNTRQSMTLSIMQQWLFQLPIAWGLALATPVGINGIWWCYPLGNGATALLCLVWYKYGRWRRNLVQTEASHGRS